MPADAGSGPIARASGRPSAQKDLAVLARAGFPFDVAREVIDGDAVIDGDIAEL